MLLNAFSMLFHSFSMPLHAFQHFSTLFNASHSFSICFQCFSVFFQMVSKCCMRFTEVFPRFMQKSTKIKKNKSVWRWLPVRVVKSDPLLPSPRPVADGGQPVALHRIITANHSCSAMGCGESSREQHMSLSAEPEGVVVLQRIGSLHT